jgi:hypothetical protein
MWSRHRADARGQQAVSSRQRAEIRRQRSEERNSLVGAAFPVLSLSKGSRDLAISTNFLIF